MQGFSSLFGYYFIIRKLDHIFRRKFFWENGIRLYEKYLTVVVPNDVEIFVVVSAAKYSLPQMVADFVKRISCVI